MWQAYIESQRACNMLGRDGGASLAGALKAAGTVGVCLDELCPMPTSYTTKISAEATADANRHKHLGNVSYDCRNWDRMIDWVTNKDPCLFGGIWTQGLSELSATNYIIRPKHLTNSGRRYYHCEYLCGWETIDGVICPKIRNTHGARHGRNGVSVITREAWDVYMRDPNTVCLAFGDIVERLPERRSWTSSQVGDNC